jgi:hypothetical protein
MAKKGTDPSRAPSCLFGVNRTLAARISVQEQPEDTLVALLKAANYANAPAVIEGTAVQLAAIVHGQAIKGGVHFLSRKFHELEAARTIEKLRDFEPGLATMVEQRMAATPIYHSKFSKKYHAYVACLPSCTRTLVSIRVSCAWASVLLASIWRSF